MFATSATGQAVFILHYFQFMLTILALKLHFFIFEIKIFLGLDTSQENALREMEDLEVLSATGKIVIH